MSNNIATAAVTIEGTRPLFWHRFAPEVLDAAKKERTGTAGNDPDEWRRTVLATPEGQLYLEPTAIFSAVRDGARYTRKGRSSYQAAVAATLRVLDEQVLTDRYFPGFPNGHELNLHTLPVPTTDPTQPVYLDVRGVKNPVTRGRNVRYRIAASPGWICNFILQWDTSVVSKELVKAILLDTGQLVGLGNGRSIGFGRFELTGLQYVTVN